MRFRPTVNLYDAHNHLQDERFGGCQAELMAACAAVGVRRMVVNGSCESDWPQVLDLARRHPEVIPSFGYHPWYIGERTPDWAAHLERFLDTVPSAVGEIGLDRWKPDLPYAGQEEVFTRQLRLAAERRRPVSIHCLRAWGRLLELLERSARPACGFLLHSYGGPLELVQPLARLGAYFGFPGYYARPGKERQRMVFRSVPADRLLIETDAPDQALPETLERFSMPEWACGPGSRTSPPSAVDLPSGAPRRANHPANLAAVYAFAAGLRDVPIEALAMQVETNFHALFGSVSGPCAWSPSAAQG